MFYSIKHIKIFGQRLIPTPCSIDLKFQASVGLIQDYKHAKCHQDWLRNNGEIERMQVAVKKNKKEETKIIKTEQKQKGMLTSSGRPQILHCTCKRWNFMTFDNTCITVSSMQKQHQTLVVPFLTLQLRNITAEATCRRCWSLFTMPNPQSFLEALPRAVHLAYSVHVYLNCTVT